MGSIVMEPEDIASYARIYHPGKNDSSICLSIGMVNSRGLFNNTNPFDYSVPLLLAQLSLASMVILFTSCCLEPLGQPSMVIQIVGGLILGPSFLGRIGGFTALVYPFNSLIVLDALAAFGYMVYFFLIGVQMDPWILTKIEKKDIRIGISVVFLAMVLSMSGALILLSGNFSVPAEVASSLPAVSTTSSVLAFPIIAHYLTELKMVNSEFGRMALSASLISNLFGFCIITITFVTQQSGDETFKLLQTVVVGLGFTLMIIFIVRPIIMWELRRNPEGEPVKQGFIFMVFVGMLATGFCSKAMGLNIFFGPLLYGIAIPAGPPLGSALMEKLDLITSWLFMPLYFVKNGLVTDVFSVKFRNYVFVQPIIILACIGKFVGAFISSVYSKVPIREAIQIGLVMNVQGVLELGMFKQMKQTQAITEDAFIVLCISMLIVTASITPILRHLHNPLRRHSVHKRRTVMDLGPDSELRLVACIHDQEDVPTTINLIENLHPTKQFPIDICLVHVVELIGRAHPILIPHKLNKVNSRNASTSRSIVNAFKLFQQSYDHGIVTVNPFTSISPYTTMHEEVCEMALDRRACLIITPFHQRLVRTGILETSDSQAGIKIMNSKILEIATCTVAIIVNRAPPNKPSINPDTQACPLFQHVAVFFIGGPDDREALAIGARMLRNPKIKLTVIRVLANSTNNFAVNDAAADGAKFDNDVVNDIRSQLDGNHRFMYEEETVRDGTGTVSVIRSIEDHYELIIVGRYHDTRSPLMLGLSAWGEDSELGAIGDMFALTESNSHSTILVVQQQNNFLDNTEDNRLSVSTSVREGASVPLRSAV